MRNAIVIGGGFAGLATGVALAERGVGVTVLEERAHLGGRAYSFRDEQTREMVDNGQHAMMGCYHHTLAFLDKIGAGDKVTRQSNLCVEMIHPERGAGGIRCPSLPSPLHVGAGLLSYTLLSQGERLRALRAGLQLLLMRRRRDPRLADETVSDLLHALGQSDNACDSFWFPVAIATLNESPQRAAAAPFAEVLARAFFGSRTDSQFVLPAIGLSEMYTDDARRYIERRGGQVVLRARVADIELDLDANGARCPAPSGRGSDRSAAGGGFARWTEPRPEGAGHLAESPRVRLADGRVLDADVCVSSVPPRVLDRLLPAETQRRLGLPPLDAFETSPIVSTHLWFDRPVLDCEFLGLLGTRTQWAFNRSRLAPSPNGHSRGQFVSAVISAAHDVVEWETARISDQVLSDLRSLVPAARPARLLRSVVVKEKNATISPTPAAERLRPATRTAVESFVLAGDWIATGLPPTIESAVLSGELAANLVTQRSQRFGAHGDRLPAAGYLRELRTSVTSVLATEIHPR